ncbi:MAG: tandem-95 repeat protein, partial [Pirellulales bacterium]
MSGTMRRVSWRRWLVGNPGNAPRRKHAALRFEPLESRQLLSVSPVAIDDPYQLAANGRLSVGSPRGTLAVDESLPAGLTADVLVNVSGGQVVNNPSYAEMGGSVGTYGLATVSGAGSQWNIADWLEVGDSGKGRVSISGGGAVSVANWVEISGNPGATGYVDVAGPGSKWTIGNHVSIGDDGGHGTLRVTGGGVVQSNAWAGIGRYAGSVGRVVVAGQGSVWRNNDYLGIGDGGLGELTVADGGVVTSGRIDNRGGGRIFGDGTLRAAVTNAGLIAPGASRGVLKIEGGLLQAQNGVIEFDITGTERGTQYDALDVTGAVVANGRAVLKFSNGFAPKAGDVFEVIHARESSGVFWDMQTQNLVGPSPTEPLKFQFSWASGVLKLTILNDARYVAPPPPPAGSGVLDNDVDSQGDVLSAVLVERPVHGTLAMYANGGFLYTPDATFTGSDSFCYRANDGILDSNVATVTIVNLRPVAEDDSYEAVEDETLTIGVDWGVLGNDHDSATPPYMLKAVLVNGPQHGTLSLAEDGSFIYQPAANYHGPDSFTYRASDGMLLSERATVALDVISVNDLPVVQPDYFSTTANTPLVIQPSQVLANDSDVDGDRLIVDRALATADTHGTVGYTDDGIIRYMPAAGFTGRASFTYVVWDGNGTNNVVEGTVYVDVVPQNPVAEDDSYPLGANGRLDMDLSSGPVPVAEGTPGFPPYGLNPDFVRTVASGQQLVTGSTMLGSTASTYGDVTVTGKGSKWTLKDPTGGGDYLVVGDYGPARLTIANGGAVWTGNWTEIGQNAGASGYVDVSGTGSRWDNSSFLAVGGGGGRGSLRVADGAVVNVADWTEIGEDGATGRVTVTGPGSVFTVQNWMEIA